MDVFIYTLITEASEVSNIQPTQITRVLKNEKVSCRDYIWKYKTSDVYPLTILTNPSQKNKHVIQYSLKGEFIQLFSSINDASQLTNTSISSIGEVCKYKLKSANNFMWRFYNGNSIDYKIEPCHKKTTAIKVLQFDINSKLINEYNSLKEAQHHTQIHQSNISKCCHGIITTAGKFIWKFKE